MQPHGHAAKAKAAPTGRLPRHACYQGQGSPKVTHPRPRHVAVPILLLGPRRARCQGLGMHASKSRATPWACSQGKELLPMPRQPPRACCQGTHNALAKLATLACSQGQGLLPWESGQGQGIQQPRLRHVEMGTLARPRHAYCHGQGNPMGMQPRSRHVVAQAKVRCHGPTAKAGAAVWPCSLSQGMSPQVRCRGQGMHVAMARAAPWAHS